MTCKNCCLKRSGSRKQLEQAQQGVLVWYNMSEGGEKAAASRTRMSVYKHGEWQEERLIRANPAAFGSELRKPRANVREIMNGAQRGSLSGSWGLQKPKGCCMVWSVCISTRGLALFSSAITAPKSLLAPSRTNRLSIKRSSKSHICYVRQGTSWARFIFWSPVTIELNSLWYKGVKRGASD